MLRYLYIGKIWLIVKKVGLLFSMMSQSAREVGSLPQSEALSVFSKALCASKKNMDSRVSGAFQNTTIYRSRKCWLIAVSVQG
jgi:hypothetical protein